MVVTVGAEVVAIGGDVVFVTGDVAVVAVGTAVVSTTPSDVDTDGVSEHAANTIPALNANNTHRNCTANAATFRPGRFPGPRRWRR